MYSLAAVIRMKRNASRRDEARLLQQRLAERTEICQLCGVTLTRITLSSFATMSTLTDVPENRRDAFQGCFWLLPRAQALSLLEASSTVRVRRYTF